MPNFKNKTEFQHHVKLISKKQINRANLSAFINTIKKAGPDHILKPVEIYDEVGETRPVFLRAVKKDGEFHYVVPLMRNLTEDESERIMFAWNAIYEDDYIFETSTPYTGEENECDECDVVEQTSNFDTNMIREFHNKWINNQMGYGWRYGTEFNESSKTHPMMLPWEQLPKSYKETYSGIMKGILFKGE